MRRWCKVSSIERRESPLLTFFNLEGIDLSLSKNVFSQEELLDLMINHVRSGDPKISQKGIDQFLKYVKDVAQANGLIGTVKGRVEEEQTDEGTRVRRIVSSTSGRLLGRLAGATPGALPDFGVERYLSTPGGHAEGDGGVPASDGPADREVHGDGPARPGDAGPDPVVRLGGADREDGPPEDEDVDPGPLSADGSGTGPDPSGGGPGCNPDDEDCGGDDDGDE